MPDITIRNDQHGHVRMTLNSHLLFDTSTLRKLGTRSAIPESETTAHEALLAAVERVTTGWQHSHWPEILAGLSALHRTYDAYLDQFPSFELD